MAGPTLSRFLGLFRLRDASNASRMAAVNAAGEVSVADTRLGEVQASPTQYTVLDRLKTIATTLAGSLAVTSTQLGEVQASPTANTVLDRLKTIATTLAGSLAITSTQLGEVQASPTANTVLDRLKTIATALASTLTVRSAGRTTATATIANAASLSGAVDLAASALAGLQMPAAWTAANLTFQVSYDGTTYADLYDALGSEYTVTASTSRFIALPASDFLGARYIKIRSGTAAVPVAQLASRDIQLVASA